MRRCLALPLCFVVVLALQTPGHIGSPPPLPEIDETVPATISSSATDCDVTGTSFCAYATEHALRATKNGDPVTLTINSVSTNTPHTGHTDTTWNIDVTGWGLRTGDILVWTYWCKATSGPNAGQWVTTSDVTVVQ